MGGETGGYSRLIANARAETVQRMTEDAECRGANAIVGARFSTSMIMSGGAEILVYGTAVVVE